MECEDDCTIFAHRFGHGVGLWSSAMTKQSAIPASDQSIGVPKQGHHRVAVRRHLPFVAAHGLQAKQGSGDVEERCAAPPPVEGLQHGSVSPPLLVGQPFVEWNGSAVKAGEQAVDRFEPVETLGAERDQSDAVRNVQAPDEGCQLKPLAIGEAEEQIAAIIVPVPPRPSFVSLGRQPGLRRKRRRNLVEDDDASVLFWQPEDICLRGCLLGVERDKTTSNAGESPPSATDRLHRRRPRSGSHDHMPRSGATIPKPCWTRAGLRHTHTRPKTTIVTDQVTPGSSLISYDIKQCGDFPE